MKAIKLGVFAITMSVFAISCGNGKTEEQKNDSANTSANAPAIPAAAPDTTQHIVDTPIAKPAKSPEEAKAAEEKKTK